MWWFTALNPGARKKVATAKKLLAEVEEKESTRKQEAAGLGFDSLAIFFHEYPMN